MSQNNTHKEELASFKKVNSQSGISAWLCEAFPFLFIRQKSNQLLSESKLLLNSSFGLQEKCLSLEGEFLNSFHTFNSKQSIQLNEFRKLLNSIELEKSKLTQEKKTLEKREEEQEKRLKEIRQTEIWITARKAELKKISKEIKEKEASFEKREEEVQEESVRICYLEKEIRQKDSELSQKERALNSLEKELFQLKKDLDIFEKTIQEKEEELNERLEKALKTKEELNEKLKEKIEEYEKELKHCKNTKETVNLFERDKSKKGKEEKLIVSEAIRQMQKICKDMLTRSEELEEKYCEGSFKGFALPLEDIVIKIDTLKEHLTQIWEYAKENPHIPLSYYTEEIEVKLKKAEEAKELWDFPSAFTLAVEGISLCSGLEIFLKTLNEWTGTETKTEEAAETADYYSDLGASPAASSEDIKKAYRDLVKKYHPDKSDPNLSEEEKKSNLETFHKIQKAYEILSNEESRKNYDQNCEGKNHD